MRFSNRVAALLLALVLIFSLIPRAEASGTLTEKGFTYTVENGEATVLSGPLETDVVIPDTLGGYPVTALGESAFSGICEVTTSVQIPETVRSLGRCCFFGSNSILSVNLPAGLEYIGDSCFAGSNVSFDEINLALNYIGKSAFECIRVNKLTLRGDATEIPYRAFLFSNLEEVHLSNSLRKIGESAFQGNNIHQLVIPEGVVELASSAFYRAGVDEITLPTTLEVLGDACLEYNSFSQVTLHEGLRVMGFGVFGGCENLKTLEVPASVTYCDYSVGGPYLEEVIGDPSSAIAVECQLKRIPFRDRTTGQLLPLTHTVTQDGIIYTILADRAIVSGYDPASISANVVLSHRVEDKPVTEIGTAAFSQNHLIKTIVIPEGVTRIGYHAFSDCTQLYYIGLPETLECLKEEAFAYTSSLQVLYVPSSVKVFLREMEGYNPDNMIEESALGLDALILGYPGSIMESYAKVHSTECVFCEIEDGRRYFQYDCGIYSTADGKTLRLDKFRPKPPLTEFQSIPSSVAGIPVTEIAPLALCGQYNYSLSVGYNVTTIDQNAFYLKCPEKIIIPDNVTFIHDRAFSADARPNIYGYQGSYAESYARGHGYSFTSIAKMPFQDVKESAWYYDEVLYVYRNGLMIGESSTTFAPEKATTRAMLVQILFNLAGDPGFDQVYGFTDVPQSAWYAKAVNWAACSGIVKGVTEDSFRPNALVTREQAAAILYRFATLSGLDVSGQADLSRFADRDQIYSYAETPMSWAVSAGILYGTSSTELSPKAPSTRAQIAAMLMRFVTWSEGQGSSST